MNYFDRQNVRHSTENIRNIQVIFATMHDNANKPQPTDTSDFRLFIQQVTIEGTKKKHNNFHLEQIEKRDLCSKNHLCARKYSFQSTEENRL